MLRHQIVERLVEPAKGKRMLARKIQHGVDRGWQPGDAAIVAAGRKHAVIDGVDIRKQRHKTGRIGGKQAAEFADIVAPVARHVEGEARQAIGVIEASPFEPFGDAEPLQHRRDGAPGPYTGKIVRAGIEAVETRFAEVARPAYEGVAESTRHDMVLGNEHLETGIGQERRRRQSADAGADNRHVDSGAAASAAEFGRRPAIGFQRRKPALDRGPRYELRSENRDQGADYDNRGRQQHAHLQRARQCEQQEQHAPQGRKRHVDRLENRAFGRFGERRTGIIGGPRLSQSHCHKADQAETRE